MYDARQIANWFVQRAQKESKTLSIMSLLKLTYISHGWHLEMRKVPLFSNRIEAWQRGPVIPDVYSSFRGQGVHVTGIIPQYSLPMTKFDTDFLEQIYMIYGHMDPFTLSEMTHEPGGPWEMASKRAGNYAPIYNSEIQAHYEAKRAAAAA